MLERVPQDEVTGKAESVLGVDLIWYVEKQSR